MLDALERPPATAVHIQAAVSCQLAEVGHDCPDWPSLLDGFRPRQVDLDEMDPGVPPMAGSFSLLRLWRDTSALKCAGLPFLAVPSSGVAVHSTSLTTTAQRARGLVQWGVLRRKRCCQGLPRGRCPRLHQPVRSGPGLASCTSRWSTTGSGC